MKTGYARASTQDQKLQLNALTRHGCGQIFREKKSGRSKEQRPELEKMIS